MTLNTTSAQEIAAKLTEAQRRALLSFPSDTPVEMANGQTHFSRAWAKASELGVSGNNLVSLQVVGGVDPKTFEAGPVLTTDDWSREGRHWSLTDLGLEVRHLLEQECQQARANTGEKA